MKKFIIFLMFALVVATAYAAEKDKSSCYPITAVDLVQENAPKFSQFPAKIEKIIHPARVNVKSNSKARTYRTVLRQGAAEGPNFAGHYTVVGWGCGTSCVQCAVINAKTGKVIFPETFSVVSGVTLEADDFEPNTRSQYWGLRYNLDSSLLIVVGTLDEDVNREGAFYFVMENDKLKPIYTVNLKKHYCDPSADK